MDLVWVTKSLYFILRVIVFPLVFDFFSLPFNASAMFSEYYTNSNEDISMILGFPLWLAYPFGIASFMLLSVSCFCTAIATLRESDNE